MYKTFSLCTGGPTAKTSAFQADYPGDLKLRF